MAELQTVSGYGQGGVSSIERNKVLRNTYTLLAMSLIPTIAGAWLAMALGLDKTMLKSPGLTLILFLVGAFGLMFAIERNKNSGLGVALLLVFTFFMGIMLSRMLGVVLGMKNGAALIMYSLGGTAAIFASMAVLGTMIKKDLSSMGKFLMVGALVVFFGGLLSFFFPMPALQMALLFMCLGIFSLYMMYDINRIVQGGETNYVSATLGLYLDIYNVFQSLLAILGIFGGDRD
ncbi:MAG: Bax inhibitor-1 family protein [Burkholderiaceae bacterium]|nr:Bax inhibitor-1 family protein [Burkholderiaceae bacterium]